MATGGASALTPGGPALTVTNAPSASVGSEGTTMESAAKFTADAGHGTVFTPNESFSYAVGPGGTMTFYKGVPVPVSQGLKTLLVNEGYGS